VAFEIVLMVDFVTSGYIEFKYKKDTLFENNSNGKLQMFINDEKVL